VPKIFGTGRLLERGLGRFINRCTRGLASYAASRAATSI